MSDNIIQFPGTKRPEPPAQDEQQQATFNKAAGIVVAMPFILIGIHEAGDGADLHTVCNGDPAVLERFLPHLQEKAAAAIARHRSGR
jgi:hypothetical protein